MSSQNELGAVCYGCGATLPPETVATVVYPTNRAEAGLKREQNGLVCPSCYSGNPWGGPTWKYPRMFARPAECERCSRLVRAPKSGNRKAQTACSRQCAVALNVRRYEGRHRPSTA